MAGGCGERKWAIQCRLLPRSPPVKTSRSGDWLLTRHSVTSWKTWILTNTAVIMPLLGYEVVCFRVGVKLGQWTKEILEENVEEGNCGHAWEEGRKEGWGWLGNVQEHICILHHLLLGRTNQRRYICKALGWGGLSMGEINTRNFLVEKTWNFRTSWKFQV